jgi:hypothetical protein
MQVLQVQAKVLEDPLLSGTDLNMVAMLVAGQAATCSPVQVTVSRLLREQPMKRCTINNDVVKRGEELRVGENETWW